MDRDKTVAAAFIFLLLGGSFLAVIWAIDSAFLPLAGLVYLLVGFAFLRRIKQAESIWDE